jgi:hypothetical protein
MHCEEDFEVDVEYDPIFNSSKIITGICEECGKSVRVDQDGVDEHTYPHPNKYKGIKHFILCRRCWCKMITEEGEI